MEPNNVAIVEQWNKIHHEEQWNQLKQQYDHGGYAVFRELLHEIRAAMKACDESSMEHVTQWLNNAQRVIPEPEKHSPSWSGIWHMLHQELETKQMLLRRILPEQRSGEWQVIIDNPFTHEGITCYPGLSFLDAAYLYAYFRRDLKKNEYIRLQKIVEFIHEEGS